MARDIFGRVKTTGTPFKTDNVTLIFSGNETDSLLVQTLSVQYAQDVRRVYEIGSTNVYLMAGETSGQMQFTRVVGPKPIQTRFLSRFGDLCQVNQNRVAFDLGSEISCVPGARSSLTCSGCHISSVGWNVGAQPLVITENLALSVLSVEATGQE